MNIATLVFSVLSFAGTVTPDTSVVCTSRFGTAQSFAFDLYPTGHPMGGVGMYSGMFVMAERENGGRVYGYISVEKGEQDQLVFAGSTRPIDGRDFILKIQTNFLARNVVYDSTLHIRGQGPLGPGRWIEQSMSCGLVL